MTRGATYRAEKPCRKCGSLERYESTQQCVPCAKVNAQRQRDRAKAAALKGAA